MQLLPVEIAAPNDEVAETAGSSPIKEETTRKNKAKNADVIISVYVLASYKNEK